MMKNLSKKNKIIIICSVVGGVIGLLILLAFTLFSLKTVSIDFRSSHTHLASEEEIVESGKFSYGGSVLFMSKKKYVERLEKANPYLEVVNIETIFPSSFVVHIKEREEVYAVKGENKYYICDDEFKVLSQVDAFESEQSNSILFSSLSSLDDNVEVGSTLNLSDYQLFSSLYQKNYTLGQQKAMIKEICEEKVFNSDTNKNQTNLILTFFNGQTYRIQNCTYGMDAKCSLLLQVYSQIFDYVGEKFEYVENGDGVIKSSDSDTAETLTYDMLKNATIYIENYLDYTHHTEKECYFNIKLLKTQEE